MTSTCEKLISKIAALSSVLYFAPTLHVLMLSQHLNTSVDTYHGAPGRWGAMRFIVALQTQQSVLCLLPIGQDLAILASDWMMSVLHTWCQTQGGQLCLITTDTLVPLNFKIHN